MDSYLLQSPGNRASLALIELHKADRSVQLLIGLIVAVTNPRRPLKKTRA
jgi:hypothetical protein